MGINEFLKAITIIIDTREKQNKHIIAYLNKWNIKWRKEKLDSGDYSAELNNKKINFAIERKASISELCTNLGKKRVQFKNEFERAKEQNTKMLLLVENEKFYEDIENQRYTSRMNKNALKGSIKAFSTRYEFEVLPVKKFDSGKNILKEIYKYINEEVVK